MCGSVTDRVKVDHKMTSFQENLTIQLQISVLKMDITIIKINVRELEMALKNRLIKKSELLEYYKDGHCFNYYFQFYTSICIAYTGLWQRIYFLLYGHCKKESLNNIAVSSISQSQFLSLWYRQTERTVVREPELLAISWLTWVSPLTFWSLSYSTRKRGQQCHP